MNITKEHLIVPIIYNGLSTILLSSRNDLYYSKAPFAFQIIDNLDQFQHLYILSDEKIQIGDWYTNGNHIFKCDKETDVDPQRYPHLKKIIASTNDSLNFENLMKNIQSIPTQRVEPDKIIPGISDDVIRRYVKEYNAGTPLTTVSVEYKPREIWGNNGSVFSIEYEMVIHSDNTIRVLESQPTPTTPIDIESLLEKHCSYKDDGGDRVFCDTGVKDLVLEAIGIVLKTKLNSVSWNREEVIAVLDKFKRDCFFMAEPDRNTREWIIENL